MAIQRFLKVAKALAALPAAEQKAAMDVARELTVKAPEPKRAYKRKVKTVAPGVTVKKRGPGRPKKVKGEEPQAAAE